MRINFPESFGTRIAVFVDTEEEFDWHDSEFSRSGHGTSSVAALRDGQRLFDTFGLAPTYLVDYPIIESVAAQEILGQFLNDGRCAIGAHLHPWVTPPFTEDVSRSNSYAGNLPLELERQKIVAVRDAIAHRFGTAPMAYRAGRYGLGPNSFALLEEAGFRCDTSERPLFDYSADGGPDFTAHSVHPRKVGPGRKLVELPLTTMFVGAGRRFGHTLNRIASHVPKGGAILARSRMLRRIPMTPEGVPLSSVIDAIDVALEDGVRLMNLSFHSPSLAIGHTPYVRSEKDLLEFYRWWDGVFAHCLRRGIQPASLQNILDAADQAQAEPALA